jgi:hypothetical protein
VCLYSSAIRGTSRGCYQGAYVGAPSPLIFGEKKLKAKLARWRENEAAWLFEI